MGKWDSLWLNATAATMDGGGDPYGTVTDAAVAVQDGRIAWVGQRDELTRPPSTVAHRVHDLGGAWLLPGLIECHTHIVHGGDRAGEFERRLAGASYAEIAKAGGGIRSTVAATREATADGLYAAAERRLHALTAEGVTTVEIKSGYGLDTETEMKQLRVARRLGEAGPARVTTSFLGAHAFPPEAAADPDGYVDAVCDTMLPAVAREGLADAVDAFGEHIALTPEQVARVFRAAQAHGLPVKLHADQLSDQGGAALAASFGALSADHLEYTTAEGAAAMAGAGTVAVLLPAAYYYLGETQRPPVAACREHGTRMAVATDCNPGSAPVSSVQIAMNFACLMFGLTVPEALHGVTTGAAAALGMGDDRGRIAPGLRADFSIWDLRAPAEIVYRLGDNRCAGTVLGGELVR